jgi:hypothetical protein
MKTSDQIDLLSAALVAMHAEIENVKADSENPHFRSKYIDLTSVRMAIKEPLAKNGLAILQLPSHLDGELALTTRIVHKSGQWLEDTCKFLIDKPTMQGLGSAITYMKRYSLGALTGIAEADDDGNEATRFPKDLPNHLKPKQGYVPTPVVVTKVGIPASDAQRKLIFATSKELGLDEAALKEFFFMVTEKSTSKEWNTADIDKLVKAIADFKKGKPVGSDGTMFADIQY